EDSLVETQMRCALCKFGQVNFDFVPAAAAFGAAFNDAFFQEFVVGIHIEFPGTADVGADLQFERWGGAKLHSPAQNEAADFVTRVGSERVAVEMGDAA